jgi:hypothetical protein
MTPKHYHRIPKLTKRSRRRLWLLRTWYLLLKDIRESVGTPGSTLSARWIIDEFVTSETLSSDNEVDQMKSLSVVAVAQVIFIAC